MARATKPADTNESQEPVVEQASSAPQPQLVISVNDLQAIIATAVSTALQSANAANQTGTQEIAKAITDGIAANAGVRRITVGERALKGLGRTPFNPKNLKRELKWEFYQNGAPMFERYLHDSEIEMLHKLKPGLFLEGMVEVIERISAKGRKQTFIKHDDDRDGRIKLYSRTGNFYGLLKMLVAEAEQQKEQRKEAARRLLAGEE